jgi:hypothetical protein
LRPRPALANPTELTRRLKNWLAAARRFAPAARASRWEWGLTAALVLGGLLLRSRGFLFGGGALWLDEASWALELMHGRPYDSIRPIAFMKLTHFLASTLSTSETTFRLLPWLAGVATTLLAPWLGARLYKAGAARLLFVAVIALHPAAIDLSKEFKPYSVSLMLHAALLLATLRALGTGRAQDLVVALAIAVAGSGFAQDLTFAFPGVFLVLGWEARKGGTRQLLIVLGGAALVLLSLGAQYAFIWSRIPKTESAYWGNKYGVFYTASDGGSYLRWSLAKFAGFAQFPGWRREWWGTTRTPSPSIVSLQKADALVWSLVGAAGLACLALRRDLRSLLLLALPLLVLWAFNALGFWPFGVFRTNLFVLVYAAAIAAAAFDSGGRARPAWVALLPAAVLVLAPLAAFERHWHATKRAFAREGHMLETLARLQALRRPHHGHAAGREPLLIDDRLCDQFEYYTELHPDAAELRARVDSLFIPTCVRDAARMPDMIAAAASSGDRVWIIVESVLDLDEAIHQAPGPRLQVLLHLKESITRIAAVRVAGR